MTERPSPRQNRVDPFGALVATAARGTMMGNRGGRFHRDDATLGARRSASRAWICCALCFKGRRRAVWGAGYTELFFLDEATALAAGHRPCFECRRADATAFRDAAFGAQLPAPQMDLRLHAERLAQKPVLARAVAQALPDGAMIAAGADAFLRLDGAFRLWSFEGYGPARAAPAGPLRLLTPPSALAALRRAYRPALHPSAGRDRA
ncbi:MAG: hypothetical protein IPL88_00455 [Rhizobiales bacterium]|nr:hypothetical protein [Hyphomicrobiales bacterium]